MQSSLALAGKGSQPSLAQTLDSGVVEGKPLSQRMVMVLP